MPTHYSHLIQMLPTQDHFASGHGEALRRDLDMRDRDKMLLNEGVLEVNPALGRIY
jgi:hypothetical protein